MQFILIKITSKEWQKEREGLNTKSDGSIELFEKMMRNCSISCETQTGSR